MEPIEIITIIVCVLIVGGVIGSYIYKRLTGKPTGGCSGCSGCSGCHGCSSCSGAKSAEELADQIKEMQSHEDSTPHEDGEKTE